MKSFDVHIHTNSDCNLSCIHCYNNSGIGKGECLEFDIIKKLLNIFTKEYNSDIHLEGGEIFLHKDIFEQLSYLDSKILNNITITTNGTIRYEDEKILNMLRRINVLRISVEGHIPKFHKAIRNSDIYQIIDNAKFYYNNGIHICFRITLNKVNMPILFDEIIPKLNEKGINDFQIYEFQNVGRGKYCEGELGIDNPDEIFQSIAKLSPLFKGNLRIMLSSYRRDFFYKYKEELQNLGYITEKINQKNSISIHSDGNVFVCPWDNEITNSLFNIKELTEQDLQKILLNRDFTHSCNSCSRYRIIYNKKN